jgi:nucleolin
MTTLEEKEALSIDADGTVTRNKHKQERKKKKEADDKSEERKTKKQKTTNDQQVDNGEEEIQQMEEQDDSRDMDDSGETTTTTSSKKVLERDNKLSEKGVPCKGNPGGVTRLFLGNLPFTVDEKSLSEFMPKEVTHIKWITDKETGKFYGSAFLEMDTPTAAAKAVALAGSELAGRPIKINFAPARPGDIWPPANKVVSGGTANAGSSSTGGGNTTTTTKGGQAGGMGVKAMGPKPENCVKLFIGNLSYDIDDDTITKFFDNVGAEVKAVRWISHKDTGDFKGVGFVEFWNSEACDKAATLNGKNLLGRPIRIDWTD